MNNSTFENPGKHEALLAEHKGLLLEELLFLYIESKTGEAEDANLLPDTMLEAMQDMGNELNRIYAAKLKQEMF
jgi:hypothetical protein